MIKRKISTYIFLVPTSILFVAGSMLAHGETPEKNERKTLAITYFANNSKLDKYDSLSKGIADMLITDLSNVNSLQIVEREQLEKLLGELKLNQSAFIDPSTAQKIGKGLGAEFILTGAIVSIEPIIRIDARIITVATAKIIKSEQVTGDSDTFFELEKELADKLVRGLEIKLTQPEQVKVNKVATKNFQAVVHYSNAIDAKDKGDTKKAIVELKQAVAQDNKFTLASTRLQEMVQEYKKATSTQIRTQLDECKKLADNKFYTHVHTADIYECEHVVRSYWEGSDTTAIEEVWPLCSKMSHMNRNFMNYLFRSQNEWDSIKLLFLNEMYVMSSTRFQCDLASQLAVDILTRCKGVTKGPWMAPLCNSITIPIEADNCVSRRERLQKATWDFDENDRLEISQMNQKWDVTGDILKIVN